MNKAIFLFFALFMLFPVFGNAFELAVMPQYSMYSSSALESRPGIEVSASHDWFTACVSRQESMIRLGTQEGADITLWGFKLGYQRHVLLDNLVGFVSAGWYRPDVQIKEAFRLDGWIYTFAKALGMTNEEVLAWSWRNVDYELKDGLGCTIGAYFVYQFNDRFSLRFGASHLWLRLQQWIFAYNNDLSEPHWQISESLDLGAFQMSIGGQIGF